LSASQTYPVCGGEALPFCSREAYGQNRHVAKCRKCGHGFVSTQPDEKTLARIYASEEHHPSVDDPTPEFYESRRDSRVLVAAISKLMPVADRGRLLDVGCGDGGFSYHLQKAGFRPLMIDLDPSVRLGSAGLTSHKHRQRSACRAQPIDKRPNCRPRMEHAFKDRRLVALGNHSLRICH
jgi:hypothetical protein